MKRLGSASNSLITLYVRKLLTYLKIINDKNSTMNSFPSKRKGSHTSFDKRHTNETSLTCFYCKKIACLIRDYCQQVATKLEGSKQQSHIMKNCMW
jgi:hypothetical protein